MSQELICEIVTMTDNVYSFTVLPDQIDDTLDWISESWEDEKPLSGRTLEGCPFLIAPRQVACAMIYNQAQADAQHRRIIEIRGRKRQIEKEVFPFEDLDA